MVTNTIKHRELMKLISLIKRIPRILKSKLYKLRYPELAKYEEQYITLFEKLFEKAAQNGGFNFLSTLLRVEGITSEGWDPYVEAEEALMDLSSLLRSPLSKKNSKRSLRIGLLIYGHAVEMSTPYDVMANLFLCCVGANYQMYPFSDLIVVRKYEKNGFPFERRILPNPSKKIASLKKLAEASDQLELIEELQDFYDNEIRNAFYHSAYTMTDTEFRIAESGNLGMKTIPLEDLSLKLVRCFAFYSAFFITYNRVKRDLAKGKKYYRWPNFEVLELLSNKDGLCGFKVHYQNAHYALFERTKEKGTMSMGLNIFDPSGVTVYSGDPNTEDQNWYVDGNIFEETGTRYNNYGYWKPIVFGGKSSLAQQKARDATDDKRLHGILFYIHTTGHKAIEFVIKSKKPLFKGTRIRKPNWGKNTKLEIVQISNPESNSYLYDGTFFLENVDIDELKSGITTIEDYISKNVSKQIEYALKYNMYVSVEPKENDDGTFSISLDTSDPRTTMVTNNLGIFPKTDWAIQEGWV